MAVPQLPARGKHAAGALVLALVKRETPSRDLRLLVKRETPSRDLHLLVRYLEP